MKLEIENYRGVRNAEIELSPFITLIGGRNRAGKSSVIQALQAVVGGETLPIQNLKKKDAKSVVHKGEKSGYARLIDLSKPGAESKVKWPACIGSHDPQLPHCSLYAAGILTATAMSAQELSKVLNILPTFEDFKSEMEMPGECNIPLDQIWQAIERDGWDATHNQATLKGRDYKRDWERLSGENWGSEKAKDWKPEHFTGQSIEELQAAVQTAEMLYEHAVKSQALNEKENQDLQAMATQYENTRQSVADLTSELASINTEISKAQSLLQALPKILNEQKAYKCWNCGELGLLQGESMLKPPDKTSEAEVAAARQRIAEQNQIIRDLETNRNEVNFNLHREQAKLEKCISAKQQLAATGLSPIVLLSHGLLPEDARDEIELCRKRITAYKTYYECEDIATTLGVNQYICAVLHPDGLRKQVLVKRLADFNKSLKKLCQIAVWPTIEVDEYLTTRFDGQPYALLSVGEKFAVNAALQIVIATLDGSQMIIIDGIDVLDRGLRNGLIFALQATLLPSVIGCTFNAIEDMPNLKASDMGLSYWCENNTVRQL